MPGTVGPGRRRPRRPPEATSRTGGWSAWQSSRGRSRPPPRGRWPRGGGRVTMVLVNECRPAWVIGLAIARGGTPGRRAAAAVAPARHRRRVRGRAGRTVAALAVAASWRRRRWARARIALTTAPLGARRRVIRLTAFWVIIAAVSLATRTTTARTVTFVAVIFAAYCGGRATAGTAARRCSAWTAGGRLLTAAFPDTTPPVPARFTALLIFVPTVARGGRRCAGGGSGPGIRPRLRQAEAEHEAATRRALERGAGAHRQRAARRRDAQRERDGGAGGRGPAGARRRSPAEAERGAAAPWRRAAGPP